MAMSTKVKIAAGAAAAVAVAGGGAAFAASQVWSPKAENQAVIDDAAKQLGVSSDQLSAALENALKNRVDAAVAAGKLTKDQGDALKARIDAGGVPFVLGGFGARGAFGPGHFGGPFMRGFSAAASYLGLSEAELRSAAREREDARADREGPGKVGRRPRPGSREGRGGEDRRCRRRRATDLRRRPTRRRARSSKRSPISSTASSPATSSGLGRCSGGRSSALPAASATTASGPDRGSTGTPAAPPTVRRQAPPPDAASERRAVPSIECSLVRVSSTGVPRTRDCIPRTRD